MADAPAWVAEPLPRNPERSHRKILTAAISVVAAAFANLLPAQYIEDRDNRNPTGATWFYNLSAASLASLVGKGDRIVDLEVARTSPSHLFTVSMVPNKGTFAKTWWYYNASVATISAAASSNGVRVVDLEQHTVGGQK